MEQAYELNLRDYRVIFLKRRWVILTVFFAVFFSIFTYTALQVPIYSASVLIKVEPSLTFPSQIVFPTSLSFARPFELSDYAKQIVGKPILEEAAQDLGWIKDNSSPQEKNRVIAEISGKVSAMEIEKSNMIRLSAQFGDPERAADIVNKIAEVFKKVNAEQKNEQARNVRIFIEQRLAEVSTQLKEQDERLRTLTMQGAVGTGVNIVQQIYELERKLKDLTARFTERHPDVVNLKGQIERLKQELKNMPKEEFEYGILKRDIAINESLYTSLKQKLQESLIKEAEKVDNIILVNPAITPRQPFYPNKTKNYSFAIMLGLILGATTALMSEHMDTSIGRVDDIESFIKVNVVGIIPYYHEKPKEEEHKKPKSPRAFFKRPQKPEEVSKPFSILVLERDGRSLFAEAFRILGVNIQVLFGKGGRIKNKIVMVTSCRPEEGKTSIISNLGVTMAQMGYKALVIDADTRRANVHKIFGLKDKENGLTDILTGKINPDEAIRTATDLMLGVACGIDEIVDKPWLNNLNLITAGSVFPNPITLFNSSKMDEVMNYFRDKYDLVLVDASPILAVSEPSILVPKVDGILLVYKAGATSRIALRRAKLQIESTKGRGSLSGIILNNVTPEIGMDAYYYGYYSKKYYGEKPKSSQIKEGSDNV
jgi:tyrosine-protein kinase Etk/Wzc